MDFKIIKLRERREFAKPSALWFHNKWKIPMRAYMESITDCMNNIGAVPQWYIVLNQDDNIIAGAGVIENDFHSKKDLSPNLCALYVENDFRGQGIAKSLIKFIREDISDLGICKIFLTTDHDTLYEKMGWEYLTSAIDDDGNSVRLYQILTRAL